MKRLIKSELMSSDIKDKLYSVVKDEIQKAISEINFEGTVDDVLPLIEAAMESKGSVSIDRFADMIVDSVNEWEINTQTNAETDTEQNQ